MVLYSNYCHSISKILYLDELAFVQYKLVIEKHRTAKTTNAYTLMLFLLHPIKANEFCACSVILIHMEKIAYGGLVNRMKADEQYQQKAIQSEVHFPAGSTWIVQTDHVSHAAIQGQYTLEQTFYLPVHAMHDESSAPLRILEQILQQKLT